MIYQGSKHYPVHEIIIHCTDTRPDWMEGHKTSEKVAEVRRWHMEDRGWKDIGYHYLIDRDGTVAKGRANDVIGAHVAGHNAGTLGISLFGGHGSNENDTFGMHFTADQDTALAKLIVKLGTMTKITKVSGHNDYAAKACPGFKVARWLDVHGMG